MTRQRRHTVSLSAHEIDGGIEAMGLKWLLSRHGGGMFGASSTMDERSSLLHYVTGTTYSLEVINH